MIFMKAVALNQIIAGEINQYLLLFRKQLILINFSWQKYSAWRIILKNDNQLIKQTYIKAM
jgi:hypothetical protein